MKTATRERVMERIVKPISLEPFRAASRSAFPHLHVADDVLQHDNGVIHHKTDGKGQGHEGEVVEAVAEQIHDGEGADDGHGQGQAGDDRGREVAQKEKDDQDDQADGQKRVNLTSFTDSRIDTERS